MHMPSLPTSASSSIRSISLLSLISFSALIKKIHLFRVSLLQGRLGREKYFVFGSSDLLETLLSIQLSGITAGRRPLGNQAVDLDVHRRDRVRDSVLRHHLHHHD